MSETCRWGSTDPRASHAWVEYNTDLGCVRICLRVDNNERYLELPTKLHVDSLIEQLEAVRRFLRE